MSDSATPLERRVAAEVLRTRDELVELLADLVRFDTRVPDPDLAPRDEQRLQGYVAERLRRVGLDVELWEPETATLLPTRYAIPPGHHFRGRPQLLARLAGRGGGRTLLLNGHIDVVTVEPRAAWSSDPFVPTIRDGRLYGRGACDMKGGVAAMLHAVEVLRTLGVPLRGDLVVNTVTDEESTGAGSLAAAQRVRADGGIITEPTELTAWLGTRGSLMPVITVHGRAGHAAYPYDHWTSGGPVNAVEKMGFVLDALYRLREEWQLRADVRHDHLRTGSIVPVALDAGQWIVSHPASATLRCHVQYLPSQADTDGWGTAVEREIEERVLAAARADPWLAEHPPEVTFYGFRADGFAIDREQPIIRTVRDAHREIAGDEMGYWIFTGTTDARFFNLYYGMPATCYGPAGANLHAPDECVDLESVREVTKVLALSALDWCELT